MRNSTQKQRNISQHCCFQNKTCQRYRRKHYDTYKKTVPVNRFVNRRPPWQFYFKFFQQQPFIQNEIEASLGMKSLGGQLKILEQALAKVKALSPEYIDNGQGGKQLVFKDETGAVMRNPENQLNPYTANDLIQKELKTLGVLDEGRKATGGGTNPPAGGTGGNGGGSTIDVSGAKTRVEANEAITNGLLAQGLTVGSDEFQSAMTQAWTDNNVAQLPEK